jgi:hypothetical protein
LEALLPPIERVVAVYRETNRREVMPIGPGGERLPYPGDAGMGPQGQAMPSMDQLMAVIRQKTAELKQLMALAEQMKQQAPQQMAPQQMVAQPMEQQPGLLG